MGEGGSEVRKVDSQRSGERGRRQEPGRRPQAAAIHSRRSSAADVVQAMSQYSVSCTNGTLRQNYFCTVRNNSPRAPLFRLAASPRGGRWRQEGRVSSKRRAGQRDRQKGRKSRQALFGLLSQCRRVLPHPPAAGRPMFPLRGNIGVVGKDFRIFERIQCRTFLGGQRG